MAKKRIANYVFLPGVARTSNAYPNAYALLEANKTFIIKETSAFIASRVVSDTAQNIYPNAVNLLTNNKQFILDEISAWTTYQVSNATVSSVFYGYSYGPTEIAKCKRDMGYLIDALIYDIRYGGNEQVSYIASQYYQSGVVQLINVPVELEIQTQLWALINNYILPRVSYSTLQSPITSTQNLTGSTAEALSMSRSISLSTIARNVIEGGLSTLPTLEYSVYNFAGDTYDTAKCERDIGYVLDAYLHDLRYGGNKQVRQIASRYWDGEVPQILGDRKSEVDAHNFIRDLINNIIFRGDYEAKCERDIGYIIDGAKYDIALGTNYNSIFLGIAEYNSLDLDSFVISKIQETGTKIAALPAIANDPTSLVRSQSFFSEVIDIATNGRSAANTMSFTNPTTATASQIAAKDKLVANKDFLAAEVNAWVALTYPTATHDSAKCTRDIKYAIDAICYDVLYGCNQATYDQAKFFFYSFANGAPGITAEHKAVTVAAYNYLKTIIDNVVQGQAITKTTTGSNPNTLTQVVSGNNASSGDAAVCQSLVQITTDVINAGSQNAANGVLASVGKTYPSVAWTSTEAQYAKSSIEDNKVAIIAEVAVYNTLQQSYPRQLLNGLAAETVAESRITSLVNTVTTIIANGLQSVPALVNGVTTIKLQGQYTLDKLLLITNATTNQILYNFSDATTQATVDFNAPYNTNHHQYDNDFQSFIQTADYITTIELNVDTTACSETDDIQIFVEGEEQKIRPYDFGTDAIERMRVAQPQSMLDADFEYGLQPTKWQAIGIARGYPSVYEVPGSDTPVISVVTDASAGTGGIGQSLITVTSQSAHGFSVGTPITIRSLANTISGFNRAEGTFIISTVPSPTTFTYYATAKVGSSNGQVLATTYTQLRKAAFYTGASIGNPTLSVYSNGQVGSFTTKFITSIGSQQIAVAGALPTLGVPISAAGVNAGTQVTGTVGPGGLAVTKEIGLPSLTGDTVVYVTDSSEILEGMAIDSGNGTSVFVNGIDGTTISLSGPLTADKSGSTETYLNLSGTNVVPGGVGASFSVDRVVGAYSNLQVTSPGTGYVTNSRVKILGSDLGGVDTVNDLFVKIASVVDGKLETFSTGGTAVLGNSIVTFTSSGSPVFKKIASINSTGLAAGPSNSYINVLQSVTYTDGTATGATFNITDAGGSYGVTLQDIGLNYQVGDIITILGSELHGIDGENDLKITVLTVDTQGEILTFSHTGVPDTPIGPFTGISQSTTSGSGSGSLFDISDSGSGQYVVVLQSGGTLYQATDTITINGSLLGGVDGVNNLIITIDSVDGNGAILTFTPSGTIDSPIGPFLNTPQSFVRTFGNGSGAAFNINDQGDGSFVVFVANGGSNYEIGDTIIILGSQVGGVDGVNDITIAISGTTTSNGANGLIQDSTTGTGTGATVNVAVNLLGQYVVTLVNGGGGYAVSEQLTILGSQLDGVDGENDLTVTVSTVSSLSIASGISQDTTSGQGSGATFDVALDGLGGYVATLVNKGINYDIGDTVTILGSRLDGIDVTNDLTLTVTGVTDGTIDVAIILSGTSVSGERSYTALTQSSTSGAGAGAEFDVQTSGGSYLVNLVSPGLGYILNEVITIDGSTLGGVDGINDLSINVVAASGVTGSIIAFNYSGVAGSTNATFSSLTGTPVATGLDSSFDVTRIGGSYTVEVNTPGEGYQVNDVISINGSIIGGVDIFNDALVTVTGVNIVTGEILSATISGTSVGGASIEFWSAISISDPTIAVIATNTSMTTVAIATIQATWETNHGLVPGMSILVDITSAGTNHSYAKGPFFVEEVPSLKTIRYTARTNGVIDTGTAMSGIIYARPQSFFIHRPFDGGVQLGTGGPQHGSQAIRMSKKYIRYQSGKGVMYNTGALFAPSYDIRTMTATGTAIGSFITVTTDDTDHGCQIGAEITINGAVTTGYNGVFKVVDITDERTFKVQATQVLGATTAELTSSCQMAVRTWHGATVRAGAYDDQNGMFWQYDGQRLAVGRRSSTFQLAGVVSVNVDSNLITGTNTRFTQQLAAGDRVVIKGMSHVVTQIASDTSMTVSPDFRGVINVTNVKLCKTIDIIVPQEEFNQDQLNGSGPSGYNVDITKMQMIGMQYTWYGAGFIDFMLRGSDGNYTFAHRFRNSNNNTEAYMRTGNLPVRYEVINEGAKGVLASAMTNSQTTVVLQDAYWFPYNGTVMIDNEMISYTGRTDTTLTGCTRAAQLSLFVSGSQRNFTGGSAAVHNKGAGVILISNTVTPIISHWGSAFLTDGRFDSDRGYIFNYAATNLNISTTKTTAFLIRLAPSVSNAIVGDLGERELLNRAQLLLNGIEITADTGTGGIVVEGVLNPQNYPLNPSDISWTGLQGAAQGGQPSFAQIAPGGSVNWNGGGTQTTSAATTLTFPTGTIQAAAVFSGRSVSNGDNRIFITQANYNTYISQGLATGDRISGTGIQANATINNITFFGNISGTNYYQITMSLSANQNVSGVSNLTVTKFYTTQTTSTVFFQQASWETTTAKAGTEVSDTLFPAGTFVSSATALTYFGTTYYRVTFSQTSTSTAITPGTTTVTFKFGNPPYAQPGETVFSFVAAPGGTSSLDLTELKELTNTTLGGRGTYPNGPDVLAINVYKSSGTAISSNIVLRWGEAQA